PNDPMHHLLRSFLTHLDGAAADPLTVEMRGGALLAACELKLLHAIGLTPQLGSCVRCGDTVGIVAYSAADGGVVCSTCRTPEDRYLAAATHAAAVELLRTALAEIASRDVAGLPDAPTRRAILADIVAETCTAHAGITARRPV
ncbi:MAG: DNA repair protein RecO C-terminal domain-containing protein, partial [Thermoleophilia bacterium]|nr:DNA repair protein RecO C-terminal domain-containing protein [Thermoleophilia bacterium]